MGDEFHAAIKLISGEEIFALMSIDENDGDPILLLQNPVIMKVLESPHGIDRKSTRLNSSHVRTSRMPSSA